MFPEFNEPLQVYRKTPPVGMEDSSWEFVAEIQGRIDPVVSYETMANNQNFQSATDNVFFGIEYEGVVEPEDGIIDPRGKQYINIGYPEVWRHLIPYVMCKLEQKQFTIKV